ncbi:MAG: hypothetical protein Q8M02_10980 [Candidatus Didemnitutus sp.]|nr:hypothetical protein [Candidatus Didemnitutus sp.]
MDDPKPANETNDQGLNKIDLGQLQAFTFGTQWSEVKPVSPGGRREREFDRGDRRGGRDDGQRGSPPRDRRGFRKPAGAPGSEGAPAAEGQRAPQGDRGQGERPPRGEEFRGGPRRDFRGGDRNERGAPMERGPYISPYFNATCYPEDVGFAAMVKAVRTSCRTFQLFEITKAVLEKNDRFVVVLQRKPSERREGDEAAVEGEKSGKPAPLFMAMPDHMPFETEEAAIQHVLKNHLARFFSSEDVEVEAPKGNFPIINKCGITGELLGPPNYHKYQQLIQQHHATKLGRMTFERFRESIISSREPEVVQAWQDKMKKATRYTWQPAPVKPAAPAAATEVAAAPAAPAPEEAAESAPTETPGEAAPVAEAPVLPTFDSFEEARAYLLSNARERVVRAVENVRFHGKLIETLPAGEIKRAVEGHVERQRRFPLDTANALRGRLRREGFTIFKKGSRGVSYVCAVKRRFRVPGQVFSESISTLIEFVEKNPMIHLRDLPKRFLEIEIPVAAAPAPTPAVENAENAEPTPAPAPAPVATLAPADAERLRKMNNDLRWLVMEGYVTEFSDGKLFAPPPVVPQSGKKADEHGEEHDPVDFPDAPAEAPAKATPPKATFTKVAAAQPVVAETEVPAAETSNEATEAPAASAVETPAEAPSESDAAPEAPAAAEETPADETPKSEGSA